MIIGFFLIIGLWEMADYAKYGFKHYDYEAANPLISYQWVYDGWVNESFIKQTTTYTSGTYVELPFFLPENWEAC